jgi:hypothetical protein
MHFRRFTFFLLVGVLLLHSRARAAIADPELDFINTPEDVCAEYGISKKEEILRLELDLTGAGRPAVFLTYKGTGSSRAGAIWTAYVPMTDGYSRTNGIQFREDLFRAGMVVGLNPSGGILSLLPGKGGGVLFRHMLNVTSGSLKTDEIMQLDYSNPDHVQLFERVFGRKLDEPMPDEFFQKPPHQVIDVKSIEARAASKPKIGTAEAASIETTPTPKPSPVVQPPAPKKAPDVAPIAPSEESTSSTPWSIIVVLIAAATGLLWLLVKKRK